MSNTCDRIQNEIQHGKYIARVGEQIWNWSSPAGQIRWERRSALFRQFIGESGKTVLEIGCGTGLFTAELVKTRNDITAIDISPDLLNLARERNRVDNIRFCRENAYDTTFADASFDVVVGSSVLHHLDIDRALKEIHRLLKPGGKFMFTEPNMLNPIIALQKNIPFLKKLAGDSPDETAFIRFSLLRRLADAGFTDLMVVPFDFVHPAIPKSLLPCVPLLNFLEQVPVVREIAGSLIIRGCKGKR